MIRFGKGEAAFEATYLTYFPRIRRTLSGMIGTAAVAEELAQEAFLRAWSGLPQFGFRSSLSTWIFRVAVNLGHDWLRTNKHRPAFSEDDTIVELQTPEQRAIQEALQEVEDGIRTILVLHYYEGLTMEEISGVLQVPTGTVKSRLHGAKSRLRNVLVRKGFDV